MARGLANPKIWDELIYFWKQVFKYRELKQIA